MRVLVRRAVPRIPVPGTQEGVLRLFLLYLKTCLYFGGILFPYRSDVALLGVAQQQLVAVCLFEITQLRVHLRSTAQVGGFHP